MVYTRHGDHGWQLWGGPYVALAVGGRQRGTESTDYFGGGQQNIPVTDSNEKISYGSTTTNRRVDAGINFGIGYRQGPVQVQLGYGLGLRNLHQAIEDQLHDFRDRSNASTAYNRVAQLTGTYFFAL